jgi:dynein heavy chain
MRSRRFVSLFIVHHSIVESTADVEIITFLKINFQKAREQWAETLWANLNVQVLQEGIEGFLKALRKLPRDVKNMKVGKILDEKMKEFRDSLPLFVDLKHEALRDRCVT